MRPQIGKKVRWGIWKGEEKGGENDIIIISNTKNKKNRKETAYFSVHKLLPVTFSFPGFLTSMQPIVACIHLHFPSNQFYLWISSVLPSIPWPRWNFPCVREVLISCYQISNLSVMLPMFMKGGILLVASFLLKHWCCHGYSESFFICS